MSSSASFSRWTKLWLILRWTGDFLRKFPTYLLQKPGKNSKVSTCGEHYGLTIDFSYSIRYPDPLIKVNDTVKIDIATGKITDFIRFDTGVIVMVTGGRNLGRVGVITHRERHDGGFNIVHIKDAVDNTFATRESNVFVIGREKPWVSLPKGKGVKVRFSFSTLPSSIISSHVLTNTFSSSPSLRSVTAAVLTPLLSTKQGAVGSSAHCPPTKRKIKVNLQETASCLAGLY